jgi:hypothetical protein
VRLERNLWMTLRGAFRLWTQRVQPRGKTPTSAEFEVLNTPSDIEDSAMVGISIRREALLAPCAFESQSGALIPLLL